MDIARAVLVSLPAEHHCTAQLGYSAWTVTTNRAIWHHDSDTHTHSAAVLLSMSDVHNPFDTTLNQECLLDKRLYGSSGSSHIKAWTAPTGTGKSTNNTIDQVIGQREDNGVVVVG
eukprot:scpid78520/ scgid25160/ 